MPSYVHGTFGSSSTPVTPSLRNSPHAFLHTASRVTQRTELAISRFLAAIISATVLLTMSMLPVGLIYLPLGCLVLTEASLSYLRDCQVALEEQLAARRLWPQETPASIYSQLKNDEFRVLVLEPGVSDDKIKCRLCICKYDDKVLYRALSYAWGDPAKVERVQCNGQEIGIASNLYEALLHLRNPHRERILWIDALCINQEDFNERGHQVRSMKTIYAQAREVLVWLGQEDDAVSKAFRCLREFKPTFVGPANVLALGFKPSYVPESDSDWHTIGFNFAIPDDKSRLLTADLVSLMKLLERPWFRRLWVLQEVAHARRVTLISGRSTVDWKLLACLIRDLHHSGLILDSFTEKAQIGVLAVVEMENARQPTISEIRRSLLSVLLATHSGECSDIRDKIYAVLNLADDYDLGKDIDSFGPDYHLSPREAFTKFARWSVARGNLDILSCTTRTETRAIEGLEGLPSWVPDWTRIDNETPFIRYKDIVPFDASASLRPLVIDSPRVTDDDKLVLSGVAIDVVKGVGPLSSFKKSRIYQKQSADIFEVLAANKKWLYDCLDLGYIIHRDPFSNYSCRKSFWRTMTAGLTGEGSRTPPSFGLWFHKYLQLLREINQPARPDAIDDHNPNNIPILVAKDYDKKIREESATIESAILMWASKRRFAVTKDGRMALVPNSTREGDIIVIAAGSRVPLVLRAMSTESSVYYISLGEAFVDELMDGRFLQLFFEKQKHYGKNIKELLQYFTIV